jgi:putative membrane protein
MHHFIVSLLINAVLVLLAAYITPGIQIKSFGTALWVAFLLAILNPILGFLFTGLFQVLTLGVFWLLGLSFILRFIAFVIVIRIVEGLSGGFKTEGFGNAMAFAIVLTVLGLLVHYLMLPGGMVYPHELPMAFLSESGFAG